MNYDAKIETAPAEAEEDGFSPLDEREEDERFKRRMWLIAIGVLVLLLAVWAFGKYNAAKNLGAESASQAPVVSVIVPGQTSTPGVISVTGTLAARRELPVGVVGEGGQVARILVEPGDWVKAGQALAVIDQSVQVQQQASLGAQVQVAEADARLAQSNLDRALQLVDRGFISKADVDRLTATRDAAAARVQVAKAQLGEIRARTRRLNIVAPDAGLVLERNVEPGQVVSPGSGVLFRIAKSGQMELLADLSESDLARISQGAQAEVSPVGSQEQFAGTVWQVSPVIDPQNRLGRARISLAYSPELRPGGFASAEISSGTINSPILPESAILADGKGSYVFIANKDDKIERRDVETGEITVKGIAVTKGLTGKERVVMRAGAFLAEGESIKPQLAKAQ